MKIWRFIWILLLIIILLCVTYAVAKWDDVQPKLAAFYQQAISAMQPAETKEKKSEPQEKKKPEAGSESSKENSSEKIEKKQEQADKNSASVKSRPLVFQVTNVSYNGGQISGFAPEGWLVQLTAEGKKLKTTQANKKDGRWVVTLNERDFTKKRVTITLSALSPNKKDTQTSDQTLDIDFSAENTAKPEITRLEKGKKPFVMQKHETKKPIISKAEKKAAPVSEKSADAAGNKSEEKKAEPEKQKEETTQKVVTASAGSTLSSVKTKETSKQPEKTEKKTETKTVSDKNEKAKKAATVVTDKKAEVAKKAVAEKKEDKKSKTSLVKANKAPAEKIEKTKQISKKRIVTASVTNKSEAARKMDREISRPEYHMVIFGDSLWKISRKYYGDGKAYWKIYRMNRSVIRKIDLIYPGQKLRLP